MQQLSKVISISIILILLILIGCILYVTLKTNYNSEIPKETVCYDNNNFDLYPHLVNWDKSKENFPYKVFLDSANRCSVNSLLKYLVVMDSINPASSTNRRIISLALTDSLQSRITPSVTNYNIDSLIGLLQWVEKFNHLKDVDPINEKLYRVVYSHWLNFVAITLRKYYNSDHSIKYDFKFKYVENVCRSKNFAPPIGNTSIEKIIFNLSESNFSYLFSKFWYDTGIIYKIVGLILVFITVYGYYCIIRIHIINKNK